LPNDSHLVLCRSVQSRVQSDGIVKIAGEGSRINSTKERFAKQCHLERKLDPATLVLLGLLVGPRRSRLAKVKSKSCGTAAGGPAGRVRPARFFSMTRERALSRRFLYTSVRGYSGSGLGNDSAAKARGRDTRDETMCTSVLEALGESETQSAIGEQTRYRSVFQDGLSRHRYETRALPRAGARKSARAILLRVKGDSARSRLSLSLSLFFFTHPCRNSSQVATSLICILVDANAM